MNQFTCDLGIGEDGASMTAGRKGATGTIGLGFRALKGGGAVVGVILDQGEPGVVVSSAFLPTAAEGDRLALEPYRVAYEMKRGPSGEASRQAAAAVAEGHKRQSELAAKGLDDIVRSLRDTGGERVIAALLVNRAGWITDALSYSLSWLEHVPVAEGLAVRDALRFACGRCGVEVAEVDEKSLYEVASKQLRLSPHDIDVRLKSLGATFDRPWRREQKLACLSAWVTVAALR